MWDRNGTDLAPRRGHDAMLFARQFVRAPLRTASLVPSSRSLATRMIEPLHERAAVTPAPVILELGPGTGAFTRVIHAAAPAATRQFAVEVNPVMAEHLAQRHPQVRVIEGSVAELTEIIDSNGIGSIDLVVSGLPWQCFAGPAGPRLVDSIARALSPTGAYTQFTYTWTKFTPPARRQYRMLCDHFGHVHVSSTVLKNFPPAFVYTARKPQPREDQPARDR